MMCLICLYGEKGCKALHGSRFSTSQYDTEKSIYAYLTFGGPYTLIYSYDKINEMHQFLKFIFGIKLYMFRTVSLSTIRSLPLYTQQ